jgi:hypothetical protein
VGTTAAGIRAEKIVATAVAYCSWAQKACFLAARILQRMAKQAALPGSPARCCPGPNTCRWLNAGSPSTSGISFGCLSSAELGSLHSPGRSSSCSPRSR